MRKLEIEEEDEDGEVVRSFAYEVHAQLPGIGLEGVKCAAFPPSSQLMHMCMQARLQPGPVLSRAFGFFSEHTVCRGCILTLCVMSYNSHCQPDMPAKLASHDSM